MLTVEGEIKGKIILMITFNPDTLDYALFVGIKMYFFKIKVNFTFIDMLSTRTAAFAVGHCQTVCNTRQEEMNKTWALNEFFTLLILTDVCVCVFTYWNMHLVILKK